MQVEWIENLSHEDSKPITSEGATCDIKMLANSIPDSIYFDSYSLIEGIPKISAFNTAKGEKLNCFNIASKFPCHFKPSHHAFSHYKFGLKMEYLQTWEFIGHTMGELVNSLSLPPNSKTKIEVFSWDRRIISREFESLDEEQRSKETTQTKRFSNEIVNEVKNTSSTGFSAGISAVIKVVSIGANSSSSTTSESIHSSTTSRINESVSKASQSYKSTRKMSVKESHEYGSETRVTKEIENQNRCYAVTYQFYEILSNFKLDLYLDNVVPVIFVPYTVPNIDIYFLRCYQGVFKANLLDNTFLKAFDALRQYEVLSEKKFPSETSVFKSIADSIIERYTEWEENDFHCPDISVSNNPNWSSINDTHADHPIHLYKDEWLDGAKTLLEDARENDPKSAIKDFFDGWREYKASKYGRFKYTPSIGGEIDAYDYLFVTLEFSKFLNEIESYLNLYVIFGFRPWFQETAEEKGKTPEEIERDRLIEDLIDHINEHKLYYLQKIWLNEDPAARYARFEQYSPIFGLPLLEVIDPEPISFWGNMGIFKFRLDEIFEEDLKKYYAYQKLKDGDELDLRKMFSNEFILKDNLGLIEILEQGAKNLPKKDSLKYRLPMSFGKMIYNSAKNPDNKWIEPDPEKRIKYSFFSPLNPIAGAALDPEIILEALFEVYLREYADALAQIGKIKNASQIVNLPTEGIICESMRGKCSAGESFIEDHRRLDVLSKEQEVRKQTLENDRLSARLAANMLEEPEHEYPTINANVKLQKEEKEVIE